jgi:hypothetical protein
MTPKLQIKDIAGYADHRLMVQCENGDGDYCIQELNGINIIHRRVEVITWDNTDTLDKFFDRDEYSLDKIKLVLKPMEMLTNQVYELYYCERFSNESIDVAMNAMRDNLCESNPVMLICNTDFAAAHFFFQFCYQNHYDINNLIGQGLAIDYRTINIKGEQN